MRTRPLASAPTMRPWTNGVKALEIPNTALHAACTRRLARSYFLKMKADPRSTIPNNMSSIGTCRAIMIAEKPAGNAVKSRTMTRISQTWFASQTGAIESAMSSRWRSRRGPLAKKSQTPPPKSAPPSKA